MGDKESGSASNPQLKNEYILPKLPKPPTSYTDCWYQWEDIDNKIQAALTSPTRAQYKVAKEGTYEFLMLGSLAEMDLQNVKAKQVAIHKAKLNSQVSLSKGGSILASVALEQKRVKEIKTVEGGLKRAKLALSQAESRAKDEVHKLGVLDRKEGRERKKWVKQQQALHSCGIVAPIPLNKLIPIRDREKELTTDEIETIHIVNQSLYDIVAQEQKALDTVRI
jgi:hypothetical protein